MLSVDVFVSGRTNWSDCATRSERTGCSIYAKVWPHTTSLCLPVRKLLDSPHNCNTAAQSTPPLPRHRKSNTRSTGLRLSVTEDVRSTHYFFMLRRLRRPRQTSGRGARGGSRVGPFRQLPLVLCPRRCQSLQPEPGTERSPFFGCSSANAIEQISVIMLHSGAWGWGNGHPLIHRCFYLSGCILAFMTL